MRYCNDPLRKIIMWLYKTTIKEIIVPYSNVARLKLDREFISFSEIE